MAGAVGASTSLGGSGGSGGHGGGVTLTNAAYVVKTLSDLAFGLQAQSIGGGGGNGGMSIASTLAIGTAISASGSVSLGGKAGGGGNGGAVSLTNMGYEITTGVAATATTASSGAGSHALVAQSIGGGGGTGGLAGATAVQFGNGGALALALGGSGGSGGSGGTVDVSSISTVTTYGKAADGIHAQSIGGGGGDGGASFSGTLSAGTNNGRISVALGGSGGSGGNAGKVTVQNQARILTTGDGSTGVLAQSIGGGGGTGGLSLSGTFGFSSNGGAVGVSVGGKGGAGGNSGVVSVSSDRAITTKGREATAVLAQSIGGGGGKGGLSIVGEISGTATNGGQIGVSVGGSGGVGGTANRVDVTLTDATKGGIATEGFASYGIKAQSIGGGGGDGGLSIEAGLGFSGTGTTANIGVSVGGKGGVGGSGRAVNVVNQKTVRVKGVNSIGIFAQSVGGGGGDGGGAITAVASKSNTDTLGARTVNVAVAIGGGGGNGNNGDAVSVVNSGAIETGDTLTIDGKTETTGGNGHAIFAQSIGGGGGIGGRANSINLIVGKPMCPEKVKKLAGKFCPDTTEAQKANKSGNIALSASVGGSGGGASDGGKVTVENSGALVTRGKTANGIYAQSVGGGGGDGGNGSLGTAELLSGTAGGIVEKAGTAASLVDAGGKTYSVTVGGKAGSSGHGSGVSVTNSGNITTYGDASDGIFAQSVGGGGGVSARAGNATGGSTFGVGGKGGAAGNGGFVGVRVTGNARIETFGKGATGIFAQSVGGGGGLGGDVLKTSSDDTKTGIGIALGGGGGGNGGGVGIDLDGSVVTYGDDTTAIFAQSVGGGGGVSGKTMISDKLGQPAFIGSNGDAGDAAKVEVAVRGAVIATGKGSTGIFAQSAGGKGKGGDVSVIVNGDVIAGGEKSTAIVVKSSGQRQAGNLAVDVYKGSRVLAGRGGNAIDFVGGNVNVLKNFGAVSSVDGYAVRQLESGSQQSASSRGMTITNHGTMTGSIRLDGGGYPVLANQAGAILNTGSELIVNGARGGEIRNEGLISPGGRDRVMTTTITTEMLAHTSKTSVYEVDLDLGSNTADRLVLNTNTSHFSGLIDVNPMFVGGTYSGIGTVEIVHNNSGNFSTFDPKTPENTAAISYSLMHEAGIVMLGYSVDFLPDGLSSTGGLLAAGFDGLVASPDPGESAIPAAMAPIVSSLLSIEDLKDYDTALRQISPQAFDASDMLAVASSRQFAGDMMSCKVADGEARFNAEGECSWATLDTRHAMRDGSLNSTGYEETSTRLSVGAQSELAHNMQLGFGLSWDRFDSSMGPYASADGHRLQLGGVFKAQSGQTSFAASVTGGVDLSDVNRIVALPGAPVYAMQSDQTLAFITGQVQIAHTFEMGDWYVKPSVSAALSEIKRFSFTESGSGPLNLDMGIASQTFFTLNPAIELGGEIEFDDTLLRPFLRAGLIDTDTIGSKEVTASISGLTGVSLPWKIDAAPDPTLFDLSAGVNLLMDNQSVLRLTGQATFGEGYEGYGANLKFSVPF